MQCLFGVVRLAAMLGLPLPPLLSSVSPPLSPRALRSEQILAAAPSDLEAASLREFVAAAQRVLVGQPDGYAVEVLECGSLAAFLRSRASLERDASGGLKATVSFFLEPEWSCAEHMSNAGAPLLFVRDAPLETPEEHGRAFADAVEAPVLALKLIRREAVEEMLAGADLAANRSEDAGGRLGLGLTLALALALALFLPHHAHLNTSPNPLQRPGGRRRRRGPAGQRARLRVGA